MTRPADPALLARLAKRFGNAPGHAAWVARHAGERAPAQESRPVEAVPIRGQARVNTGIPAVWSAYS